MIIFFLLIAAVHAKWRHLMTVDPKDGTWQFTSSYWHSGEFGQPTYGDFINDTVRHMPITKIKITSTNSKNQKAWKVWDLEDEFKNKSFSYLIHNTLN